tara:strand:+ start:63642 stop:63902 length:261 start_codon:yes stop_codon:yes gene_type:complete
MSILKSIVLNRDRMAKFVYAKEGVLYYKVDSDSGISYEFPVDMNDKNDIGTASFNAEIKAATLMRYIRKAISDNELRELGNVKSLN